jgi:exodeoxyribonuclease VII large subunit
VDDLRFRLESLLRTRLGDASRRFDLAVSRLGQRDLRQQLSMRKRELLSRLQALAAAAAHYRMQRRSRLEQASGKLETLSPLAILQRGYSLIFDSHGNLVKDAAQVQSGDAIHARLARGEFDARVESVREASPKTEPE